MPSDISCLRNSAAAFLSFFVSVGRSKKTSTHMILYSLKRSIYISGYISLLLSPLKHLTNEDVVCDTATISGLLFPPIDTSVTGIFNNLIFIAVDISASGLSSRMSYTIRST